MSAFKVGDLVRLKSGGPVLTVDMVADEDGGFSVCWFAGRTLCHDEFAAECLCMVEAGTQPDRINYDQEDDIEF